MEECKLQPPPNLDNRAKMQIKSARLFEIMDWRKGITRYVHDHSDNGKPEKLDRPTHRVGKHSRSRDNADNKEVCGMKILRAGGTELQQ